MTGEKKLKKYTFDEIKDEFIGKIGTPKREQYEFELKLELMGEMIKNARQQRNLTQTQLGDLVGVQKAQISKLENNASNVSIETIMRVFKALKARVNLRIELMEQEEFELAT